MVDSDEVLDAFALAIEHVLKKTKRLLGHRLTEGPDQTIQLLHMEWIEGSFGHLVEREKNRTSAFRLITALADILSEYKQIEDDIDAPPGWGEENKNEDEIFIEFVVSCLELERHIVGLINMLEDVSDGVLPAIVELREPVASSSAPVRHGGDWYGIVVHHSKARHKDECSSTRVQANGWWPRLCMNLGAKATDFSQDLLARPRREYRRERLWGHTLSEDLSIDVPAEQGPLLVRVKVPHGTRIAGDGRWPSHILFFRRDDVDEGIPWKPQVRRRRRTWGFKASKLPPQDPDSLWQEVMGKEQQAEEDIQRARQPDEYAAFFSPAMQEVWFDKARMEFDRLQGSWGENPPPFPSRLMNRYRLRIRYSLPWFHWIVSISWILLGAAAGAWFMLRGAGIHAVLPDATLVAGVVATLLASSLTLELRGSRALRELLHYRLGMGLIALLLGSLAGLIFWNAGTT